MKLELSITPEPHTQAPIILALREIEGLLNQGALSGRFTVTHQYVATGQAESDQYECRWGILETA